MISVSNKQELESRLSEAVNFNRLRQILEEAGISANKSVKLSIKSGDMEVVKDFEIPNLSLFICEDEHGRPISCK